MRIFILLIMIFTTSASFAVTRFKEHQVQFTLQNNDGSYQDCVHELLSHLPYWSVKCGDRKYTVNTWVEVSHNKPLDLTKVTLMYDVSEGVASSGEKMVQFNSHFTNVYVESLTYLKMMTSDVDVLNGQGSLVMKVEL